VQQAAGSDNRISSFVLGIVKSPAFRMSMRDTVLAAEDHAGAPDGLHVNVARR
jgi:hypothetical protein